MLVYIYISKKTVSVPDKTVTHPWTHPSPLLTSEVSSCRSKLCIPHLLKSPNPHILNISPPLNMKPRWFKDHVAYTMAKYGMSMCILGMAEEFRDDGIACNALWPRTGMCSWLIFYFFIYLIFLFCVILLHGHPTLT